MNHKAAVRLSSSLAPLVVLGLLASPAAAQQQQQAPITGDVLVRQEWNDGFFTKPDPVPANRTRFQIRPRFEVQYGYKYPPDTLSTPDIFVSQRTRLNASFTNEKFKAYVSLQDARIWGDEINGVDVPAFGLHEGWAQYMFNKTVSLKVGRQELSYDNKRLLTDGLWIQQGRSWDAGVLKLALEKGWRVRGGKRE